MNKPFATIKIGASFRYDGNTYTKRTATTADLSMGYVVDFEQCWECWITTGA